jgi:hypothetical protein
MVGLLEDELRRQLPATVSASASTARSSLRIAVNADSLATWFLPALAELAQAGNAWLDVTVADQDQTAEGLRRGQVLAAVTSQAQAVPGCRSRIVRSPLPADDPLRRRPDITQAKEVLLYNSFYARLIIHDFLI